MKAAYTVRRGSGSLSALHVLGANLEDVGGHMQSARGLCAALARTSVAVKLYSLGPESPTAEPAFASQVFASDLARAPVLGRLRLSRQMRRSLLSESFDLIHAHGLWTMPFVYAGEMARRRRTPFVISPHGMLSRAALKISAGVKRAFSPLNSWVLRQADCFHAASEQEVEDCRRARRDTPVALVPWGFDAPEGLDLSSRWSEDQRTLLFLGRLHPIKNLESLIEAWKRVENRHPSWRLRIVGPGDASYRRRLEALAEALPRILIQDPVGEEERSRLYKEAALHVLPSLSENFGMTVVEALSYSVPVIVTKRAPWPDLELQGCGWWVEPDADSLAAALDAAMGAHAAELRSMGEMGRVWVTETFTWPRVAEKMKAVYEWLARSGDRPAWVY